MGTNRFIRARMLMTRETTIPAPFTQGIATDLEYFQLSLQQVVAAQDLIAPTGIATQRKGWTYDGTVADAASLTGVARSSYVLSGVTRTVTTNASTSPILIHNPSSAGTALLNTLGGVLYLPRCIYRDELILCAQDGVYPLIRYSGAGLTPTVTATTTTWTTGQATLTAGAGAWDTNATRGAFVKAFASTVAQPSMSFRILERNSATSITVEGVRASATVAASCLNMPTGWAYPGVVIYNAGTISIAANVVTGVGTKWVTGAWGLVNPPSSTSIPNDALLVIPAAGGSVSHASVTSVASDTSLGTISPNVTNSSYAITRSLPFKDAAAHRGSLWGTGVAQFPDRVYVGPPGWNLSLPPGAVEPYDPSIVYTSANAQDFLLSYVDVPSPFDGDTNVAILPSPGPLLVLKRFSVYGVFGSYPSFQVSLIADGAGCADIRTAISVPEGQFWASELGVFTYRGGHVVELTAGRINREWRAMFRQGSGTMTAGVVANHLVVVAGGVGQPISNYVYDLAANRWVSKFSNFAFGNFWRTKVTGTEQERLLGVTGTGRVCDVGPAFDIANLAGSALDGDGNAPRMQATTGPALAQAAGIDGEAKLLDVAVDANLYDASTPTTTLAVSVTHSGGLENSAQRTKTLGSITADTNNLAKRTRFRDVNRAGRLHSLSVDVTPTDNSNGKVEIPEIVLTFRDTRAGT